MAREIEYERHAPGEPLYVNETLRKCPGCGTEKQVRGFQRLSPNSRMVSTLCVHCLNIDQAVVAEEKKSEELKEQTKAVATLTNALKGKRGVRTASLAEAITTICKGKTTETMDKVGTAFMNILDRSCNPDADMHTLKLAEKVGGTLLRAIATSDKLNTAPAFDWDSLTEDEAREFLFENARQLLLSDARFRKQLLNCPDVRELLLADAGVQVLEGETV